MKIRFYNIRRDKHLSFKWIEWNHYFVYETDLYLLFPVVETCPPFQVITKIVFIKHWQGVAQ